MANRRNLHRNQDYYKIRNYCLEHDTLFEDDYFERDVPGATWLRPGRIVREPSFFVEGASGFDVVHGGTTDCWLIVAMANLRMNQTFFQHVVPHDQSFRENYVGMFFFRIWQCGKWVEVVVDDRLPTKAGHLIYTRSRNKNEFWSALLEKAYAKLYGSYSDLTQGWFCEGMVDFTGGIVDRVNLSANPKNIASIVALSLVKKSFMCVFMNDNPRIREQIITEGLVKGHAYSITHLINLGKNDLSKILVRLRNPWGDIEWNGAWSDSSPEWGIIPEEEKKKIGLVYENDGEFWMSMIDFTKHFQYIDICHLSLELFEHMEGKEHIGWEANQFTGEWIKGVNAGGFVSETFHFNPQYKIILTDTGDDKENLCSVIIALMQKNKDRNTWYAINFTAYLLDGPEKHSNYRLSEKYINGNFQSSMSSKLKMCRENVVHDKWKPGAYCIIPSTQYPNQEGQFLLRVYSENKALMEESEEYLEKIGGTRETLSQQILKDDALGRPSGLIQVSGKSTGKTLLQKNDQEVEDFFHKISGDQHEIGWEELQILLDYALGNIQGSKHDASTETDGIIITVVEGIKSWLTRKSWWSSKPSTNTTFSKDKCRRMVKMLDDDLSGKLGSKEFNVLWKKMRKWESVFLLNSKEDFMIVPELKKALVSAGYDVNTCDLGRLARRYADSSQQLGFDDFIMCAIEVETDGSNKP